MHRSVFGAAIVCAIAVASSARARTPQLDGSKPVTCMDDPKGRGVRVQCAAPGEGPVCLWASACAGDPAAAEACKPIERAAWCNEAPEGERWADLAERGYSFVAARADVTPGWY